MSLSSLPRIDCIISPQKPQNYWKFVIDFALIDYYIIIMELYIIYYELSFQMPKMRLPFRFISLINILLIRDILIYDIHISRFRER